MYEEMYTLGLEFLANEPLVEVGALFEIGMEVELVEDLFVVEALEENDLLPFVLVELNILVFVDEPRSNKRGKQTGFRGRSTRPTPP